MIEKTLIFCFGFILSLNNLCAQNLISLANFEKGISHLSIEEQIDTLYEMSLRQDLITTPETIPFARRSLSLSLKIDSKIRIAKGYTALGTAYEWNSQFEKAITEYQKSLKYFTLLNEERGMMIAHNNLSSMYRRLGQYKKSFDQGIKSLKKAEDLGLAYETMAIGNNIAVELNDQKKYEQAKIFLEGALEGNPPTQLKQIILGNLGISWKGLQKLDTAIYYYKQSLELCDYANDSLCGVHNLNNIGNIYFEKEDYKKSIEYSEQVIKKLEGSTREQDLLILSYNNTGGSYIELGEYEKALIYLNKALSMAEVIKPNDRFLIHKNLSEVYEKTGQYKLSLEQLKIYWEIQDSLISIEKNKQIEESLAKYESEKKEKEIAQLKEEKLEQKLLLKSKQAEFEQRSLTDRLLAKEKENEILQLQGKNELQKVLIEKSEVEKQQQDGQILLLEREKQLKANEAKRQSLIRNGVIIVSILLLIPAIILVIVYQHRARNRELLHSKTEELNRQKILEVIREHELKAVKANIEGQEKEKKRISRELHDGIAGNLAGIKLMLAKIAGTYKEDADLKKVVTKLDDTYKEVRTITHQLTPPGMHDASFCQLIGSFLKDVSSEKEFNINFICHPKKDLNRLSDEVKIEIYRVIQELVINITKHAKSDHVEVQLIINESDLNLLVEDNGVGFDTKKAGRGIGLSNIRSRVTKLNGNIDIDSSLGRGTIINVDIPIAHPVVIEKASS